mgnify:CR=1 FL=1
MLEFADDNDDQVDEEAVISNRDVPDVYLVPELLQDDCTPDRLSFARGARAR